MVAFTFRGVQLHLAADGKTLVDPAAPGPSATAEEKLDYMRKSPIWGELTEELIQLFNDKLIRAAYLDGAIGALDSGGASGKDS